MPPPPRARMQWVADRRYCVCGGRAAVGSPGEAAAGLTLSGRWWGKPSGVPVGGEATLLAVCPSPARCGCSRHHSHPAYLPPIRPCRLPLSPSSPGARSLLAGTAWLGKEPDSSRPGPGRCRTEQSHLVTLRPWKKVGGRCQSWQVPVLVGDAVHGSEVMSGSPVIGNSVPQAAACPRVPRSEGVSCSRGEPTACDAATEVVLSGVHRRVPYPNSPVFRRAAPSLPHAVSALPVAMCPLGLLSRVYPWHLGGSGRCHRGSMSDIEGKRLE